MKKYVVVLFVLCCGYAYAQAPQQPPDPLATLVEQRIRTHIGDLTVTNVILNTRVEALIARVTELEKQLAEAKAGKK